MSRLLVFAALTLSLAACEKPAARPILEATTSPRAEADDPTVVAPDAITTPAEGARAPLVVVTIFADLQCHYCRAAEELADKLLRHWPDEVQIQYRQLPLEMHHLARAGAVAVLAAHQQGQFACLSHALFASQEEWRRDDEQLFLTRVLALGEEACGLDGAKLEAAMHDSRIMAAVDADIARAEAASVNATPTFLVNGKNVRARTRGDDMSLPEAVRAEVTRARRAIAGGADRATWLRQRVKDNLEEVRADAWLLGDQLP